MPVSGENCGWIVSLETSGKPEAEGATHACMHVNLSGERTENAEQRRSVCCFVLRAQMKRALFLVLL